MFYFRGMGRIFMNFIEVKNVSFRYSEDSEDFVIKDLNLVIKKGEFVAIIGPNGSGKSTLAKLFNALMVPSRGDVIVKGMNTRDKDKIWDIRKTVGLVFQNPDNQLVASIVEEDVAFGPENLGIPPAEIRQRVENALKAVGMYNYKDFAVHLLSGGQKQRVAIAGLLAMLPECIVLDEPTAMLDPVGRKEVINTVTKLNREKGITVIYITHFMDETLAADRILVMDNGRIVLEDTPINVFKRIELLKGLNLDVPPMVELAYLLNKEGVPVNQNIITIDEMVNEICQLL